jgi:hypothetical protein
VQDPGFPGDPDDCDGSVARYSGTSMATPAVAGLAAYMWSLDPSLSPEEIARKVLHSYDLGPTRGLIDAYAAVLSLDTSLNDARVRSSILDVAGGASGSPPNGAFDENDVESFLNLFDHYELVREQGNVDPDYSRYDLNGDGYTGGGSDIAFDLDVNDPPSYGTVSQTVARGRATYDENALTDVEILCYYAHSELYTGDEERRRELLGGPCGGEGALVMSIRFPDTIAEAEEALLEVRAGYEGASGDTAWSGGILIELEVDGGTTTASSGVTDPDGWFRTSARLDPGSRSLSITVTARNKGGQEETETVVADADGPSFVRVIEGVIRADALFTCSAGDYGPGYAPIVESDRVNDRRDLTGAGSWTATAETGTNITHPFTNDQASARGAASVELNIDTFDAGDVVARISGSTSMFAEASSTRNDNHNGAGANGHTYLYLFFEIVGEPLHYELTSSFDGTPGQVDFFGEFYHHASDGPITAPQISGTLGGSRHRILISDVTCSASTNGGETSCEDGYEFVLTLTRR